ncbi:HlyIII-domain-containing protein [Ophiobolus disseminans]|uniref:HlyIII-domain-containing protein n=1 Tax=Ophiobolus disseminans TaxID=1469910 RepID=A0A6A6ZD06_9PLEO|nr:HlyIII-domain-containing protein [Ophiobolus disseminans]
MSAAKDATAKNATSSAIDTKKAASSTLETTKEIERKIEQKLTYLWHEISPWQQDNHYIISGYRPQSNSYLKSLQSLLYLHNETVNIYTHLFGAILAFFVSILVFRSIASSYSTSTHEDVYVFACFFAGAIACLGMSATYHTISNHSHEVARFGNQLDYAGIVLLIWGSFVPVVFYGFQRDPELMRRYWAMITTLAACTSVVSTHSKFRTPALRPFRALMFVLMGLSAVFPVIHGIRIYGVEHMQVAAGLNYVVLQGILYILGAVIYAARIPEKWFSGKFDIWGSSHQIFHVLVVLAAATHFCGLYRAFREEQSMRSAAEAEALWKFNDPLQRNT